MKSDLLSGQLDIRNHFGQLKICNLAKKSLTDIHVLFQFFTLERMSSGGWKHNWILNLRRNWDTWFQGGRAVNVCNVQVQQGFLSCTEWWGVERKGSLKSIVCCFSLLWWQKVQQVHGRHQKYSSHGSQSLLQRQALHAAWGSKN